MPNDGESLHVGHFSDLHYSTERLVEADRCFGFAVEDAVARGCHVGIVSGDATDHRLDAHTPALRVLAERIHALSGHMPVLMLQGTFSHEPPGTLDLFRLIGSRHPVYVADRIHQVALVGSTFLPSAGPLFTVEELETLLQEGTPSAVFTCVPTVNKAVLAGIVGAMDAATAVGEHLTVFLGAAGKVNRLLRSKGIRTIGVSHGTVNGCYTEHGVPMAGFDHEFSLGALFEAECDAFMLGHIHAMQLWEREGRLVGYAGSIGCFHYGEKGKKGYLSWQIKPGRAEAVQVETPARETVCVDFDGPPDMERLANIAEQTQDKFVRVRWTIDEEHRQLVDREAIRTLFAGAAELKLDPRVLPAVRSRAEGISRAATLGEKVQRWCGLTDVKPDALLERLSILEALEPQDIADRVTELAAQKPLLDDAQETLAKAERDLVELNAEAAARKERYQRDVVATDDQLATINREVTSLQSADVIHTQTELANGDKREGFEIRVHDAQADSEKEFAVMSGGQKVWINECLTRGIALYRAQGAGTAFQTLFTDEADGPLDPERKREFMKMKREVLRQGGYEREFFISQTPDLVDEADAVIDVVALATQ